MSLNVWRSKWIAALAVGLVAVVAASSAGAFGKRRGGPGLAQLEHRLEKLDLSADVRAKAYAIVDAQRAQERALREQIRTAHQELGALVKAGTPDIEAVDAQIDELGVLKTQQHKQFLHALLKIGALLPEQQRAQWFEPPHRRDHHRGERQR